MRDGLYGYRITTNNTQMHTSDVVKKELRQFVVESTIMARRYESDNIYHLLKYGMADVDGAQLQ